MSIATASTSAKTAEPTPATINTNAAENTTASKQYLKLAGLILGLSTILLLMLLSFVSPLKTTKSPSLGQKKKLHSPQILSSSLP